MNRVSFVLIVLFNAVSLFAQKEVELIEKEVNGSIIISAKNTSKTDFNISLKVESKGLRFSKAVPSSQLLKAGQTKELVTLIPKPLEPWSYNTSVSYSPASKDVVVAKATTPSQKASKANSAPTISGIVLYTKAGCGRCTTAKEHLKSRNIKFKEVDISKSTPEVSNMWSGLREQGFMGSRISTPVVAMDGVYYHEISDLRHFLDELVAGK